MKSATSSPLRLKEAFLLLPVLLLGGGALYWQRLEKVAPPQNTPDYIESIELKPASGKDQERGYTHNLVVTINYGWPKPTPGPRKVAYTVLGGITSFQQPIHITNPVPGSLPEDYIASLGELIWKHGNKTQRLENKGKKAFEGNDRQRDDKFIFSQPLALQNLPPQGEIVFHGAYIAAGRPFEINRVIRKEGEKIAFENNHVTGGHILSTKFDSWTRHGKSPELPITFHLHINQQPLGRIIVAPFIYDLELVDGNKHVYPDSGKAIYGRQEWLVVPSPPTNESVVMLNLDLAPGLTPPNPLTLRGKISIDNNWPILFSIKLPTH